VTPTSIYNRATIVYINDDIAEEEKNLRNSSPDNDNNQMMVDEELKEDLQVPK
jgi:hypothetical protein